MADIASMLGAFSEVAAHPSKELDKHLAAGKRVIGVGPYHVPEELVYAAGAIPFGVWGMVGSADEAKKYYPPFYCSICQMTLEMGLKGILDKLSGMMITGLCDTLRASSQNWKAAMGNKVPLIYVTNAQNRFLPAGRQYSIEAYTEVKRRVEECCDTIIDDVALMESIKLYNKWRAAMREFVQLAGSHPAEVSNAARVAVVNAGYYMDKAEHLGMVEQLIARWCFPASTRTSPPSPRSWTTTRSPWLPTTWPRSPVRSRARCPRRATPSRRSPTVGAACEPTPSSTTRRRSTSTSWCRRPRIPAPGP